LTAFSPASGAISAGVTLGADEPPHPAAVKQIIAIK
jgi:hypothetical protein